MPTTHVYLIGSQDSTPLNGMPPIYQVQRLSQLSKFT